MAGEAASLWHSSAEERAEADFWSQRMYAVAEEHGYTKLDVIRAGAFRLKNPRPDPSKQRPKLKGGDR